MIKNTLGKNSKLEYINQMYENITPIVIFMPQYFLQPEVIEKLVTNLNYTMDKLNGHNALKLKVNNMEELKFKPRFILKSIIKIYIAFSKDSTF